MGVFTVGRQVGLEILMPGWWLSGASVDMDFRNSRYFDSASPNTVSLATDFLSCTRASTGYARNSSGTWISFASNQLRITDLGLLVEDARTNNLLNSSAPATQTTASLATGDYTLWVEGSGSALASAGSATITGAASATQNNPDTFTVTVAGTVTVTISGSLTKFQLELGVFPSSFILTTGAAATRAQDLVMFTGSLDTLSSASVGTMLVDSMMNNINIGNQQAAIADFTTLEFFFGGDGTNNDRANVSGYGVYNFVASGSIGSWTGGIKCGQAWNNAGPAGSISAGGGTVTTSTSASIWNVATTKSQLGGAQTAYPFYGYFRRLTAWNSKLADVTLQVLTAP